MSLMKLHRKLKSKFQDAFKVLSHTFFNLRDKRGCNSIVRDTFPDLFKAIEVHTGRTIFKLNPAEFHTLLTGEVAERCNNKDCSRMCGYDVGKRKYKEFCSKQCANSSGVIRIRRESTMLDRYGVVNAYASKEIQDKIKQKHLSKYGVANPSSSKSVQAKRRKTFQTRYGVNSPMESDMLRSRQVQAVRLKYGVDNVSQSEQAKQKSEATCMARYGVKKVMHCPEIAERTHIRSIEGSMKKYGVPNAMLHPEVLSKWQSAFGRRTEMNICGKTIYVQGYERFAFERIYDQKPFAAITTNMPEFAMVPYTLKGKSRMYVPDAAIKMSDGRIRVVEVKSWFTLKSESNIPKFKAATKHFNSMGMDFVLVIAEPKNNYIRVVINPKRNLKSLIRTAGMFSTGRRTW